MADGSCVLSYPVAGNLDKARAPCPCGSADLERRRRQSHSFLSDDIDFNKPGREHVHLWKWVLGTALRFDIRTESPRDISFR